MRRKKERVILENVTVSDVAAEGKAIAKVDDMVIFINQAIPGDVVNIALHRKKKNYAEGTVVELLQASPDALQPFCSHFGDCGGCKWQRLPYAKQLAYKERQVYDQLSRIGGLEKPLVKAALPSKQTLFYRNKLEFTFSNKRWMTRDEIGQPEPTYMNGLGFHVAERFDKVLDVQTCYLQAEPSNSIRLSVRKFATDHGYEFFDIRNQTGFLRNLIIRTTSTGEIMVIVVFYHEDEAKRIALLQHLQQEFPQINSLLYIINTKGNDNITDQQVVVHHGKSYIEERMEGLTFRIGAKSFYQTNSEQAYRLYHLTREYAALTGEEVVYDLYTGIGTIANFVAPFAKKVVGIEYIPEAIEDAWINSSINGIKNTVFYAGDMKNVLNEQFILENGKPDIVILDPPRAGIHPDVIEVLLKAAAKRIVYVSCNPATQARDLSLLGVKYDFIEAKPVDMFPHTHHIENIALLTLRSS